MCHSIYTENVFQGEFMKRAFLFLAVAMLFCNPTLAQEPDPDPNLLWVTENYYTRFLVLPNGNILAGKHSTEVELDGNTGEIIREFPYPTVFYDVSPDGKYISALTDWMCVIDYETEEVIVRYTQINTSAKFMPDSKTLVCYWNEPVGVLNGNLELMSYNIETKGYRVSENSLKNTTTGIIAVSPDGRFVATGGRHRDGVDDYTHLVLWDAQTLEPIKILGEFENANEVRSIIFSTDSRLVGFSLLGAILYIYDTDNFSLNKYDGSIYGFGFVTNDFIAIGNGKIDPPELNLVKLDNDQILYSINNSGGNAVHNITNNTMIVIYGFLYCYDFEKILTGASIEPKITNPFMVEYTNNSLSTRNFTFVTNQISCSITDVNGRVIRKINLNTSTNEIRIPIKLISGTYFLHIKDGSKEYVSKFLVVE